VIYIPHLRSSEKLRERWRRWRERRQQKHSVHQLLFSWSYHDIWNAELVCTQQALDYAVQNVNAQYGFVYPDLISRFEAGEVLVDSKGQGSLQKIQDKKGVIV